MIGEIYSTEEFKEVIDLPQRDKEHWHTLFLRSCSFSDKNFAVITSLWYKKYLNFLKSARKCEKNWVKSSVERFFGTIISEEILISKIFAKSFFRTSFVYVMRYREKTLGRWPKNFSYAKTWFFSVYDCNPGRKIHRSPEDCGGLITLISSNF